MYIAASIIYHIQTSHNKKKEEYKIYEKKMKKYEAKVIILKKKRITLYIFNQLRRKTLSLEL